MHKYLITGLLLICFFGLKAQNREILKSDCSQEFFLEDQTIEYHSLQPGQKYYINFPHNQETENLSTQLIQEGAIDIFWQNNYLIFTATKATVFLNYPAIDPSKTVYKCESFYIAPFSSLMMDEGIQTETGIPIDVLIGQNLLGDVCLNATNVSSPLNNNSYGIFTDGESSIGLDRGIVLATGNIAAAEGPNNGTFSSSGASNGPDPDIASIVGSVSQNDVIKVEFDFVPDEDMVSFEYVFASEEYCDFVNSSFNDAFGFFISGPGISGPYTNNAKNIALIPGTTTPVTINNVNWSENGALYFTNQGPGVTGNCTPAELNAPKPFLDVFGFDGFTAVFTAETEVIACETYHIKLVIADIGDSAFDSGIFLKQNSFVSGDADVRVNVVPGAIDGSDEAEEGCENGYFAFEVDPPDTEVEINFEIQATSTATEGVDYESFPTSFTIPAGTEFDTLWIDIFSDILIEGVETIDIKVLGLCDCEPPVLTLKIKDPPIYEKDVMICQGSTFETSEGEVSEPGQYFKIIETPGECDSLTLINLSLIPAPIYDTTIYRCITETLEFEGETFLFAPMTKEVVKVGSSELGCDSIIRVNFQWSNPDLLLDVSDVISCTTPTVDISIFNNPIPEDIDGYYWLDPNQDTLYGETITVSTPGEYNLISYIELEDRICTNFFPNNIEVEADPSIPIIENIENITSICNQSIPEINANLVNDDILEDVEFSWILPDGTEIVSDVLQANEEGQYFIIAENEQNGCLSIDSFEIEFVDIIPEISVEGDTINCASDFIQLETEVDIEGGMFNWVGPNGFISDEQNPEIVDSGLYVVEYSLSDVCVNTASVQIALDNTIPSLIAEGDTIICNQGLGELSFQADNIASFMWTGPDGFSSNELNPQVEVAGDYQIEVIATNGCVGQEIVSLVNIEIIPELAVNDTFLNCFNSNIQIEVEVNDPNLNVNWSGPDGFTSTELNPEITEGGAYTIIVQNQEGCFAEEIIQVEQDTISPELSIDGNNINCEESTALLSSMTNGNILNYIWEGPDAFNSEEQDISVTTEGVYSLTVQAENGCVRTENYFVEVDTLSPLISSINDTLDCNTSIAEIGIAISNPNVTISWLNPSNNPLIETDAMISVNQEGNYTAIVIDTINKCESSAIVIASPNELTPDIALESEIITCENKDFTINSQSSFSNLSYDWSGPNGFTSNLQNPVISEDGEYFVEITSTLGCKNNSEILISSDLEKPSVFTGNDTLTCLKPSVSLILDDLSFSNSYEWTSANGFSSSMKNPEVDEAGIYNVVITADNFCDTTASLEIAIDTSVLDILAQEPEILTCTDLTSIIQITQDYSSATTYEWQGSSSFYSTEKDIIVDEAGIYQLVVTAENGCTKSRTFEVLEDKDLISIETEDGLINCYSPTLQLTANFSSSEIDFLEWTGPESFVSNEAEPITDQAGNYTIQIIGTNGCISEENLNITADFDEPNIAFNNVELSCKNPTDIIVNSTSAEYLYTWFDENNSQLTNTTEQLEVSEAGIFYIIATNELNGCSSIDTSIVIKQPDIQGFDIEVEDPNCLIPQGSIEIINLEGGTPPFKYSIDGGQNFQDESMFSQLGPGSYEVLIEDFYECFDSTSTSIISIEEFDLNAETPFQLFIGDEQQLIVETALEQAMIDTIIWSPNTYLSCTNCLDPVTMPPDDITYTVKVIDNNGCEYEAKIELRISELPYFIPNVFTPNDDGQNEYFTIFGELEYIQNVNDFSIYDRWGERVFFTENVPATDESMKWYGDFKGKPAKAGVYAYYLEYISLSGKIIKVTGDVTILR